MADSRAGELELGSGGLGDGVLHEGPQCMVTDGPIGMVCGTGADLQRIDSGGWGEAVKKSRLRGEKGDA